MYLASEQAQNCQALESIPAHVSNHTYRDSLETHAGVSIMLFYGVSSLLSSCLDHGSRRDILKAI